MARVILAAIIMWFCCGALVFAGQVPTNALMHESFQQFDQSLDTGWRVLQVQRDYLGAAKAMLDYLSVHPTALMPWPKDSLAFHLGISMPWQRCGARAYPGFVNRSRVIG